MSYNTNMATITVGDTTYDVETHSTDFGQRYTIQLDGEDVFEGLEGLCENEQYIEEHNNPRDASNVGTMALHYHGYNLGGSDDEDIRQIEFEVKCPTCDGSGESPHWVVGFHRTGTALVTGSYEECQTWLDKRVDVVSGSYYIEPISCSHCKGECVIPVNPVTYFKQERGARVVVGLTVYEHSGITMRAGDVTLPWDSDRWDTSFVGFIFDTPEQLKQTMGDDVTDKQIEEALRSEVNLYASYLEGDVCWYKVEDDETNFHESCGGYVGDHETCEQEMFMNLEIALVKRIAEEYERAYWLERGVVTI
jgi:hypothetical protein